MAKKKKSKEPREEPLGTMFYQTSSKRGTNQKPERRRPFGTGLVKHRPQGLFSPFFTFLRALLFRPFRLSLAPTICPWVSEDVHYPTLFVDVTDQVKRSIFPLVFTTALDGLLITRNVIMPSSSAVIFN